MFCRGAIHWAHSVAERKGGYSSAPHWHSEDAALRMSGVSVQQERTDW
jgi:hypothetical protein